MTPQAWRSLIHPWAAPGQCVGGEDPEPSLILLASQLTTKQEEVAVVGNYGVILQTPRSS